MTESILGTISKSGKSSGCGKDENQSFAPDRTMLVGLIVVHGPDIEGDKTEQQGSKQNQQKKPFKYGFIHYEEVP